MGGKIKHEILLEGLSREDACIKEKELIKKYNSTNQNFGYNISTGGDAPYGVVFTEERKEKISKAQKGRKHSAEHIAKLPQIWKKGHIAWNKGIPQTKETIEKIKATRKCMPVLCIETNIKYESIRDAYKKTNIMFTHIAEVCKGIRKTAGGYHWQYVGGVE